VATAAPSGGDHEQRFFEAICSSEGDVQGAVVRSSSYTSRLHILCAPLHTIVDNVELGPLDLCEQISARAQGLLVEAQHKEERRVARKEEEIEKAKQRRESRRQDTATDTLCDPPPPEAFMLAIISPF
jgi:hypothetical protein